jgi:Sulfotransferase family
MTEIRGSTDQSTRAPTVVFVCSAGHCGSTLLDLLLGSHPQAMSLGEITQLPKNLALNTPCACGQPVRECRVWSVVVDRLTSQERFSGVRADPYALHLGLFEAGTVIDRKHQTLGRRLYRKAVYAAAFACWRWDAHSLARFTAPLIDGARNKLALFDVVADAVSRPVLVDSSKHYLEAVALHRAAPERTKVLLLIRDGRAVFYSGLKRGHPRHKALDAWRRTYERAIPLLSREIPRDALLELRYEDLARSPAQELHRICSFVGIGYDAAMLDFRSVPHHVVNGNDMRLARSGAIRADDAWRTRLSDADRAYFEARGGGLNRDLGYST